VAAEDKNFYQHKGIDESGVIRAFVGNLAQSRRLQGGSTITQQIAKNLLVGPRLLGHRARGAGVFRKINEDPGSERMYRPACRPLMLVSHPALPRVIDVASLCRAFLDSTD
jgi:hypothetical protein